MTLALASLASLALLLRATWVLSGVSLFARQAEREDLRDSEEEWATEHMVALARGEREREMRAAVVLNRITERLGQLEA